MLWVKWSGEHGHDDYGILVEDFRTIELRYKEKPYTLKPELRINGYTVRQYNPKDLAYAKNLVTCIEHLLVSDRNFVIDIAKIRKNNSLS